VHEPLEVNVGLPMIRSFPKPKTLRLKGKKRTEFRKRVFKEKGPFCYKCKQYAPLYVEDYSGGMAYIKGECGEVRHRKSVGSGGPDILDNVDWSCFQCHEIDEHGPQFGKGK